MSLKHLFQNQDPEILRELSAIRLGLNLLVNYHLGADIDLRSQAESEAERELRSQQSRLGSHRPYGPEGTIQTDNARIFTEGQLNALGDETEMILRELENESPELARDLRAFIQKNHQGVV